MKAWQASAWCEPKDLKLTNIDVPTPGPGQVRIRSQAAALNFFDILQIQGKYQVKGQLPYIPGSEVAGVIDAVGDDVTGFAVGDRVMAFTSGGGYAECVVTDSFRTFHMPLGMEYAVAAAMPIAYHTSWFALNQRGRLQAGEWLLVHAGASGVGMAAIQLGKALGARVIATAGDDRKVEFAIEQGADFAMNYSTPDWVDRVKEITERRGADVIYDPVGGDIFDLSTRCIAREGRILVIGFAGGRIAALPTNRLLLRNISAVGVFWGDYVNVQRWYLGETQTALNALYQGGRIRPVVGKRYPLDQASAALCELAERRVVGKAVLEVKG